MKRGMIWGLGILLAGCAAPPPVAPPAGVVADHFGVLTYVDGEVFVQTVDAWTEVEVGQKVVESSVIKTGAGSSCDVQFEALGTLHLAENTVVSLATIGLGKEKKAIDLELVSGTLTAKVAKLLADQRFHVRTDTVVAGVRGTRFLVSKSGAKTSVAVAEGLVALVPPADAETVQNSLASSPSVGPGFEAQLSRAGEVPVIGPVGETHRKLLEPQGPPPPSTPTPAAFGAPRLEEPASGAILSLANSPSVTLRWSPVPEASGYEVGLSIVEAGQTRNLMTWTTPDASVRFSVGATPGVGHYLWQVVALRTHWNLTEDRTPASEGRFRIAP